MHQPGGGQCTGLRPDKNYSNQYLSIILIFWEISYIKIKSKNHTITIRALLILAPRLLQHYLPSTMLLNNKLTRTRFAN